MTKLTRKRIFSTDCGHVLTLYPNGLLCIRRKRERNEWFASIKTVREWAVKKSVPEPKMIGMTKRKAFKESA